MIGIKKVEVQPLDINYGKIIDSFSTTDDKTKNAPSINAVEEYVGSVSFPSEKIAVIEQTLTFPSGTQEESYPIDFPSGFTKYNSVVLSAMVSRNPTSVGAVWRPIDAIKYVVSNIAVSQYDIELGDTSNTNPTKININTCFVPVLTEDITRYFRIVLMRID